MCDKTHYIYVMLILYRNILSNFTCLLLYYYDYDLGGMYSAHFVN